MTFLMLPFGGYLLAGVDVDDVEEEPACRVCGCTDERACPGGCYWVPDPEQLVDLCSDCAVDVTLEAAGA